MLHLLESTESGRFMDITTTMFHVYVVYFHWNRVSETWANHCQQKRSWATSPGVATIIMRDNCDQKLILWALN